MLQQSFYEGLEFLYRLTTRVAVRDDVGTPDARLHGED